MNNSSSSSSPNYDIFVPSYTSSTTEEKENNTLLLLILEELDSDISKILENCDVDFNSSIDSNSSIDDMRTKMSELFSDIKALHDKIHSATKSVNNNTKR